MQRRVLLVAAGALMAAGCGYVGDPLPPALNIPEPVKDLRAVQRSGTVIIEFTAPALTTEALAIREFRGVELQADGKPVPVESAEPGKPVRVEVPAAQWAGREIPIAVRFLGPKGKPSEWSETVRLAVRRPLNAPTDVRAESHRDGVRVSWQAVEPGVTYRVYRQGEGEKEPALLGSAQTPEFIDKTVTLGKTYQYTVQTVSGNVESESSGVASVLARDVFPPAAPSGLTAVAGVGSIELTWERNAEADLRGYRVYRAGKTGDFEVIAEAVENPSYSDRQTVAGTVYRYQVAAVDQARNESARSATVEVTAP